MNIIIQGSQGQGKTLTADYIARAYPADSVIKFFGFKRKDEAVIIKHLKDCRKANITPLIIFDNLAELKGVKEIEGALTCCKLIRSLNICPQIDTILITQQRLNIYS